MNKARGPSLEIILYLIAFSLALLLRLVDLGRAPLTDVDARWALEALRFFDPAAGAAVTGFSGRPIYIFLTGYTFMLAGVNDFLARFWPALLGSLLVWAAYLFRNDLGRVPALIIAFGLAIDPGLVVIARQPGGPMPAIATTLLALGLWRVGSSVAAGVFGALALLSGPALWPGLLGLLPALWLGSRLLRREPRFEATTTGLVDVWEYPAQIESQKEERHFNYRHAGISALITLILAGSGIFLRPQLFSATFNAIIEYIGAWTAAPTVGPLTMLAALLVFEAIVVGFALLQVLRTSYTWDALDPVDQAVNVASIVWAALALFLALVPPGRQTADLGWSLIPMWILAGREISRYIPAERPHPMALLQAGLVIFLGCFFWLTLITREQQVTPNISWTLVQIIVLAGIVVLGVLTTSLVALGWSWETARDGTAWGLAALLLVYTVAALWGAAYLRPNRPEELWGAYPGPGQVHLLQDTLRDLSLWNRGFGNEIEIYSTVDSPAMRWALASYPNVRFGERVPEALQPAVVITAGRVETPELTAAYRGQDFVWETLQGWSGALPPDFKDWLAFRRAPVGQNYVILWARTDLFPGEAADGSTP